MTAASPLPRPPTVGDIMTAAPRTIDRNETLDLAEAVASECRIRHLPVMDGTRLVGVLSQRDLFQGALAGTLGYGAVARARILRTIPVKEVMSEPPVTVDVATPVPEAARIMLNRRIGCLPVLDHGNLVGLVTGSDLIRHAYGL